VLGVAGNALVSPLTCDYDVLFTFAAETTAARTASGNAYSVAYEMKLDPSVFGRTDAVHFNRANAALDAALRGDSVFAAQMEQLSPNGLSRPPTEETQDAAFARKSNQECAVLLVRMPSICK